MASQGVRVVDDLYPGTPSVGKVSSEAKVDVAKDPPPQPQVSYASAAQLAQPAAASSSVGSAEQPATLHRSAEPSASRCHLKILSIGDVSRWLAEERIASCSSADMQRIREAVVVLLPAKPRKEDVRPLLSKWQVTQKKTKR